MKKLIFLPLLLLIACSHNQPESDAQNQLAEPSRAVASDLKVDIANKTIEFETVVDVTEEKDKRYGRKYVLVSNIGVAAHVQCNAGAVPGLTYTSFRLNTTKGKDYQQWAFTKKRQDKCIEDFEDAINDKKSVRIHFGKKELWVSDNKLWAPANIEFLNNANQIDTAETPAAQ